jgi:hypothetical protein
MGTDRTNVILVTEPRRKRFDFSRPVDRLFVALCVGAGSAAYCYLVMSRRNGPRPASDFTWHWLAAKALINGSDPYVVIHIGGHYALDAPYIYPLTTAIIAIPFALWLNPVLAATAFISSEHCADGVGSIA